MDLLRDTAFEVGWFVWSSTRTRHAMTVVIKATFELVADGMAELATAQALLTGDEHHDDDVEQSVRYESDLAPTKPCGESLLVGSCYAPGGRPASSLSVGFRVGGVRKSFAVVGNRIWSAKGEPTPPVPFSQMRLCWERCFGGRELEANPVGRGLDKVLVEGKSRVLLPNVEDPQHLLVGRSDRPAPHGAWPIPRTWRERLRRAGTYDARWLTERWPACPADLDERHHLASPPDQRIEGFWRGDERIVLHNLHPELATVDCRLPGLRPRALLCPSGGEPRELDLACDTVVVDSDAGAVYLLWRAAVPVTSPTLDDLAELFVTHEERSAPLDATQMASRLAARRDAALAVPAAEAPPEPAATGTPPAGADEPQRLRARVERALQERASCAGWVLAGADLSRLDLSGADFRDAVLAGANLAMCACDGAALDGAVLSSATLDGASFRGASLERADLAGASVRDAVFDQAKLDGALAADASLAGASLTDASWVGGDLARADLTGAKLERVDLTGADLGGCTLDDAQFVESRLIDASLEEAAHAHRVRLDGCDLTLLRASDGADFQGASLRGVQAAGARFARSSLDGVDLSDSVLDRADFSDASLEGASLGRCRLRGARLAGARLGRARLIKADLFEATLEGADLTETDLRSANLFGAETYRAKLGGTRLEGAFVKGTKLA